VFIDGFPLTQLAICVLTSFYNFLYIFKSNPFKAVYMNRLELLNELTICLLSYLVFSFTDYQWNSQAKINTGWVYCAIILVNFLGNLGFMTYMSAKNLHQFIVKNKTKKVAYHPNDT